MIKVGGGGGYVDVDEGNKVRAKWSFLWAKWARSTGARVVRAHRALKFYLDTSLLILIFVTVNDWISQISK